MTRASDSEREAIVGRLRQAAAEGRLTVEELDERIDAAYAASTQAELEPLTADLPAAPATVAGKATSFVLGIFGAGDRRGRWRVAERVTVVNVMGGADLDLREATLAAPEVTIRIFSLMGGSDVYVPENVHIELSGFALMGGDAYRVEREQPPPGAPVVHIKTFSLMGGNDVKTSRGRRRSQFERSHLPPPP